MAKQIIEIGNTGKQLVDKLANNFDELYSDKQAKLLFLSANGLTTERPSENETIMPVTWFGANPGEWQEIINLTTDIDTKIQFVPDNRFSAKIWLLSEMARNVQIRLQAIDISDDAILASATTTATLIDDGVTPIPIKLDNIYQLLRELPLSQVKFTISIMPNAYGIQIGIISYVPDEISFVNVASTSESNVDKRIDELEEHISTASEKIADHEDGAVAKAGEEGIHGFRKRSGILQFNDGKSWIDIHTDPTSYKTYGVAIDLTNSNPETSVAYTDDAIGMTGGSETWDTMPIFKDIKPCMFKDGVVQYYLNPDDYTQKADGGTADIISGDDGDVMIEIPKMGFQINISNDVLTVKITEDPADVNFKYYAHTRDSEGDRENLYIGAYLGGVISLKLRSLSGRSVITEQTLSKYRTFAQSNGEGYDIVSFYPLVLLQCLYLIRFKNLDSQSALGRGYVDGNSSSAKTGGTNTKGMNFGETTGTQQMKLLGIEDFWGNTRWWIDGIWSDDNYNILTAFKDFNDTGEGYINRGQGVDSSISGYMSLPQGTSETGFIAKEVSGSATTYFSDNNSFSPSCVLVYSGYRQTGNSAGIFNHSLSFKPSAWSTYTASRLMYL